MLGVVVTVPTPLQRPFDPHIAGMLVTHMSVGSSAPAGSNVQTPACPPCGRQVSQIPLHGRSQQTPWTQLKPVWHMLVVVHEPPRGTSPQLSPTQVAGAVHWFMPMGLQTFVQAFVSHRPGAQLTFAGVTQVPLPLHVEGGT